MIGGSEERFEKEGRLIEDIDEVRRGLAKSGASMMSIDERTIVWIARRNEERSSRQLKPTRII